MRGTAEHFYTVSYKEKCVFKLSTSFPQIPYFLYFLYKHGIFLFRTFRSSAPNFSGFQNAVYSLVFTEYPNK